MATTAPRSSKLNLIIILSSVVISGFLWYLANELSGEYWYCLWLAPVPVLFISFRLKAFPAFIAAYVSYVIGRLSWFGYLSAVASTVFAIIITLTTPLLFALSIIIVRKIVIATNSWLSVFAFPVFVAAIEFAMTRFSHDGSASSLAYTQMRFLPVIQIAAVTGMLGITFITALFPSAIAVGLYYRRQKNKWLLLMATSSVLVLGVLLFGVIRLNQRSPASSIHVGLVSLNEKQHDISHHPDFANALHVTNDYAKQIDSLARQGATIITIPERALNINDSINEATLNILKNVAQQDHVYIIAAYTNFKEAQPRNSALVIDATGNVAVDYNKAHMVTGFEDWFTPGNKIGLFTANQTPAGVAICKDLDYPQYIRQYGKSNISFIVVPAWDFEMDDWLHSRMAVLRGVENGFSEMRAAREGRLTISDSRGRILYEASTAHREQASLTGALPLTNTTTLYARYGDWFGVVISIAAFVFVIVFIVSFRKRSMTP